MKPLNQLVRSNIWNLAPYSCARNEYSGADATVFLDANENPYNSSLNRYPDPLQRQLKQQVSTVKNIPEANIFLGNGSDEAIDLVYRIFCQPGKDNAVAISPTYGMYKTCADINDVEYRPVLLDPGFCLNADRLLAAVDANTKLIFICSPNNPTGNSLQQSEMEKVLRSFEGLVVIDEAYSDFSQQPLFRNRLDEFPNLVVLNTMSKAWASAGIRLGMAFASEAIIHLFNNVKYPYNVNVLAQQKAMDMLQRPQTIQRWLKIILQERETLMDAVQMLPYCKKVYPTDANFFLAQMDGADSIYQYLVNKGIIVRNRSRQPMCEDCLRITVGSPDENTALLSALRKF